MSTDQKSSAETVAPESESKQSNSDKPKLARFILELEEESIEGEEVSIKAKCLISGKNGHIVRMLVTAFKEEPCLEELLMGAIIAYKTNNILERP